jgi:hypothetical protein
MHRFSNIKFANAKQAKEIYTYKNIKQKLYKINAVIWYNKTCREKHLESFSQDSGADRHQHRKPELYVQLKRTPDDER